MKTKFYLYGCALGAAVLLSAPGKVFSQCSCPSGATPSQISSWASLYPNPTTATTSVLNFPKFDPSIGQLQCITIKGKISAVSQVNITNNGETSEFLLKRSLVPSVSGPGLFMFDEFDDILGPDSLFSQRWIDSLGYGSKSITHGPDSIYTNLDLNANITTNFAAYSTNLGTPVQLNYQMNGGLTTLQGGINFTQTIITTQSGAFNLVYFWCPQAPLATNIKNFNASMNDNVVNIQWQSESRSGSVVELQVSTDGKNYTSIYVQPTTGNAGNHQYTYDAAKSGSSVLYFRIKNTDASGKVTYTAIKKITRELANTGEMGIFPNPALDRFTLKFGKEVEGNLSVDVINLTGQVVLNRTIRLNKNISVPFELATPLAKGMYYIRATNRETGVSYVNKLFMQ
ncbi:MAG: T9SS type A sorting domain-containing protein [Chitinophagaceae bacterium]|nr:T9SS type A sorting domain-containing protein [Chitinophagaceae bacterium]